MLSPNVTVPIWSMWFSMWKKDIKGSILLNVCLKKSHKHRKHTKQNKSGIVNKIHNLNYPPFFTSLKYLGWILKTFNTLILFKIIFVKVLVLHLEQTWTKLGTAVQTPLLLIHLSPLCSQRLHVFTVGDVAKTSLDKYSPTLKRIQWLKIDSFAQFTDTILGIFFFNKKMWT